jgi:F0F1-type ATP synthase membrane subunit b/b'
VTTQVKAEAAVAHMTHVVRMAEDAVGAADRRIAKAKDHLAQAEQTKVEAEANLAAVQAELSEWVRAAGSFASEAAPATAHNAGARTESNN